jgi:hypothetical protein
VGLTPAAASNTLSCHRETLHQTSSDRSNSLDADHGIYRDPAAMSLRCPVSGGKRMCRARSEPSAFDPAATDRATQQSGGRYSMTSSARSRIDGGAARPSALAVLALRIISYLVGT